MCYSCMMMQSEFEEDEPWAAAKGLPPVARGLVPITDTLVHQLWPFLYLYMFHNMSCSGFPASLANCSFNYTVLFNLRTSEKDNMTAILGTPTQKFWPTTKLPFWLRPLKCSNQSHNCHSSLAHLTVLTNHTTFLRHQLTKKSCLDDLWKTSWRTDRTWHHFVLSALRVRTHGNPSWNRTRKLRNKTQTTTERDMSTNQKTDNCGNLTWSRSVESEVKMPCDPAMATPAYHTD